MSAQYSQEHGERVDRCVTDVCCFRIGKPVCEGKCRWVGCCAGDGSAEAQVVDFVQRASDNAHDNERDERDECRKTHEVESVAVQEHIEELDAGIQTYAAQEQGDAEFAEHEVCAVRHEEVERPDFTFTAQDDGDDKGTPGQPKLERRGHSRNGYGNATDDNAKEYSKEGRENFWFVKCCERVAEFLCCCGDPFRGTHNLELVGEFNAKVEASGELEFPAGHAADRYTEAVLQGELLDALARDFLVGHEDGTNFQFRFLEGNRLVLLFADNHFHLVDGVRHADYVNQVPDLQNGIFARHVDDHFAAVPCDDYTEFLHFRDVLDGATFEVCVRDGERAGFDFLALVGDNLFVFRGGRFRILLENGAEDDHDEDDANNAERVGYSVADSREACINAVCCEGRIGGSERRGVGDSSAKHADQYRDVVVHIGEIVYAERRGHSDKDNAYRKNIKREAMTLERVHKTGTHLHTYGVDKED